MSKRNITTQWREFEKLVLLLERHLMTHGAEIRSPDYITDKVTGGLREVDISIRYQVDSAPILITIECRNQESLQDVTWIEQLVTKRNDIGALATIAVSSKGFTKPAIKKARFYNIETRLLKEISEDTVKAWANKLDVVAVRGKFKIGQLRLRFRGIPVEKSPPLSREIIAGYSKGNVEYKFIKRLADSQLISIADLLRDYEQNLGNHVFSERQQNITVQLPPYSTAEIVLPSNFPSLFEDVPIDKDPITKLFSCKFEPMEVTIDTVLGPLEIEYLEVDLHLIRRVYPSQIGRLLAYDNDEGSILKVAEHHIVTGNEESIKLVASSKGNE